MNHDSVNADCGCPFNLYYGDSCSCASADLGTDEGLTGISDQDERDHYAALDEVTS